MISFKDYTELKEASYAGNIGIMELIKFYEKATPDLVKRVKDLIAKRDNAAAWDIVQGTLGVALNKRGLK